MEDRGLNTAAGLLRCRKRQPSHMQVASLPLHHDACSVSYAASNRTSGDMCDEFRYAWSCVASMMPVPCGHDAGSPVPFPALFGWSVTGEDGGGTVS